MDLIFWLMGGFFVFCLLVYAAVAIFLPEWVGIQGKVAKNIESGHEENSKSNDLPLDQ